MKQSINSLIINTVIEHDNIFFIVNDTESMRELETRGSNSINLNGYDLNELKKWLGNNYNNNSCVYMLATDNSTNGLKNAADLKLYFNPRGKRGVFAMNYIPLRNSKCKTVGEFMKQQIKG